MIVPAIPLAELLKRLNVISVDVMKIDIEGFEPEVLRSFFSSGFPKPKHIFFEYFPFGFPTCDETVSVIRSAGYSIQQVNGKPFEPPKKPLDDNLWAELNHVD